jgi:hypothetical protein
VQDLQAQVRRAAARGGPVSMYLARVPSEGIPGATQTSGQFFPGKVRCEIWRLLGDRVVAQAFEEPVHNPGLAPVPGPAWRPVWRDGWGTWWDTGATGAGDKVFNAWGSSQLFTGNGSTQTPTIFPFVRHAGGDIGFAYDNATGIFLTSEPGFYHISWDIRAFIQRAVGSQDTDSIEITSFLRFREAGVGNFLEDFTTAGARRFFEPPANQASGFGHDSINHACLVGIAAGIEWKLCHDVAALVGTDGIQFIDNGSSITVMRVNE